MSDNIIKRRGGLFPVELGRIAEQVTKPAFKRYGVVQARLMSQWDMVAGKFLAEKTQPIRVVFAKGARDNGTLELRVADGTTALSVQHLEPDILEKIATFFGYRAVSRIKIIQAPLLKKKTPKVKPPEELPAATRKQVADAVENIEDPVLKELLQNLGEAIARKNKD